MNASHRTAVLILGAGLLLSGCSSPPGQGDGRDAGPSLPARTVAEDDWQAGPAEPERHEPYPYDIDTHCGIKWAQFAGRQWVLDSVFPSAGQVQGEPPSRDSRRLAGYRV